MEFEEQKWIQGLKVATDTAAWIVVGVVTHAAINDKYALYTLWETNSDRFGAPYAVDMEA